MHVEIVRPAKYFQNLTEEQQDYLRDKYWEIINKNSAEGVQIEYFSTWLHMLGYVLSLYPETTSNIYIDRTLTDIRKQGRESTTV